MNFFAMVLNPVATPNIVGPTMLGVVVSVDLGLLFIVNILIVRINRSLTKCNVKMSGGLTSSLRK